jgi:hypothetical protein
MRPHQQPTHNNIIIHYVHYLREPSTRRDAIGDVEKLLWPQLSEILEHLCAHDHSAHARSVRDRTTRRQSVRTMLRTMSE